MKVGETHQCSRIVVKCEPVPILLENRLAIQRAEDDVHFHIAITMGAGHKEDRMGPQVVQDDVVRVVLHEVVDVRREHRIVHDPLVFLALLVELVASPKQNYLLEHDHGHVEGPHQAEKLTHETLANARVKMATVIVFII